MASPLVSRGPQCLSCIRRMTLSSSAIQQNRGKKQLAKDKNTTVKVQLLQNVPGYGRRGSIIPVPSGLMRNIWYPKRMAGYATAAKLEELGKKDVIIERDSTFGKRSNTRAASARPSGTTPPPTPRLREDIAPQPAPIRIEILSPKEATRILMRLLPPHIDFYRTPVAATPAPPRRLSPSIPASSLVSAEAEAAAAERAAKDSDAVPGCISIYGSVSTSDVAANIKAVLAEDEAGQRVVLGPENITFVEESGDKDRVKHLGSFTVEIQLDDATDIVQRIINVNAQE